MNRLKLISVTLLLLTCACATRYTKIDVFIPHDFQMATTEVEDKIPLTAGLYLTQLMRNLVYNGPISAGYDNTTFFMGDAICSGSERVLRNIFKDVVIIDPTQSDFSSYNLDVIVTPELIGIFKNQEKSEKYKESSWTYVNFVAQLVMKWNIVSLNGKEIYINTIKGEITPKQPWNFSVDKITAEAKGDMMELLNDQFLKAQNDLYSNNWWRKQWWKDTNQ